jgi:hypothetical protein
VEHLPTIDGRFHQLVHSLSLAGIDFGKGYKSGANVWHLRVKKGAEVAKSGTMSGRWCCGTARPPRFTRCINDGHGTIIKAIVR